MQVWEMRLDHWNFVVLSPAFTVHMGFKVFNWIDQRQRLILEAVQEITIQHMFFQEANFSMPSWRVAQTMVNFWKLEGFRTEVEARYGLWGCRSMLPGGGKQKTR